MSTPSNIADCSTEQLFELAASLRAIAKSNQWDDLRRQLDALIELESKDLLIAGLEMINTAILCRQTSRQYALKELQEKMDLTLAVLHAAADTKGTVYP